MSFKTESFKRSGSLSGHHWVCLEYSNPRRVLGPHIASLTCARKPPSPLLSWGNRSVKGKVCRTREWKNEGRDEVLMVAMTDGLQRDRPFPRERLHQLLTSMVNASPGWNERRLRENPSVCEIMRDVKIGERSFPTDQIQQVYVSVWWRKDDFSPKR